MFIDNQLRLSRLEPPTGEISIVLDTDTKNEIDDQFAVVYALTSPKIKCEAIYAAPFKKGDYHTAGLGMEASFQEIKKVLEIMDYPSPPPVYTGSDRFVSEVVGAVESDAARDLIRRCQEGKLIYVVAIGALSNIASALLLEPQIAKNMVLLWLGGHPDNWHTTREFNLFGDFLATRIVLDSGVPMVRFPCRNVAEHIRTCPAEMERYVAGLGKIGAYLTEILCRHVPGEMRSKVLWDLAPLAWLVQPAWMPSTLLPTPKLNEDLTWDLSDPNRHLYRVAIHTDRDQILKDFVTCLRQYVNGDEIN